MVCPPPPYGHLPQGRTKNLSLAGEGGDEVDGCGLCLYFCTPSYIYLGGDGGGHNRSKNKKEGYYPSFYLDFRV